MIDFLKYFFNPSTIALLLGGILTSLFGFLAAISKEEKTPKWIAVSAFVAGIIVLFAGVMSGYQQHRTSKILLSTTRENAQFAKTNAKLNNTIANLVTGGDSYCYVFIGNPSKSNISELLLRVEGEYPLYDVKVQIQDMLQFEEIVRNEVREGPKSGLIISDFYNRIYKSSKIINIGNIAHNKSRLLGQLFLPKDVNRARYDIHISARNGNVLQLLEFRRIKGKWIYAEKLLFNNEVVKKYIPPDFPRGEDSKSLWEE